MYFFYIDESGTGFKDKQSPYFSLGALAIKVEDWPKLNNQISALKRQLIPWALPEDWEIKGRDIRRGENFFSSMDWNERVEVFLKIAQILHGLPLEMFIVRADKTYFKNSIQSDEDLYRLTFWRLLDEIDHFLSKETSVNLKPEMGMLMLDSRASSLRSDLKDRRLIDAYQNWVKAQNGEIQLTEMPWFGNSAFYSGLQAVDFVSYLTDFIINEVEKGRQKRRIPLEDAFDLLKEKMSILTIP